MSVLAYPRIHFRGQFLTNPNTCNNDDVMANIDPARATLSPTLAAMSDAQARTWLLEGIQAKNLLSGKLDWYLRSGWNYYGDMSTVFQNATVSAVVGTDGKPNSTDDLIGQTLQILGDEGGAPVMVDLDPRGGVATQIFLGGLSLGDATVGLNATSQSRCYSRWLMWRTLGDYGGEQGFVGLGATWQFAIPNDAISYVESASSPILTQLQTSCRSCQGILVQFTTYQLQPELTDVELLAEFKSGKFPSNPAIGFLVGTIGLWENGELMTAPSGRRLQAATPATGAPPLPFSFGPATARVQPDRPVVSLNLISTFPEANFNRPPVQKMNLGSVQLSVIPPAGTTPIPLGSPIDYNYPAYAETGGIVDVAYDASVISPTDLAKGDLILVSDQYTSGPILCEANSRVVVETDDRAMYSDIGGSVVLSIQVLEKEGPPTSDVTLSLFEYQNVLQPGGPGERYYSLINLVDPSTTPQVPHCLDFPKTVVFPAGQTSPLLVKITAVLPGPATLVFTQDGKPFASGDDNPWSTASFANIRVMPDDDYDSVPASEKLTWSYVYAEIFRYHDLLFPAMSQYIPFDNEQAMIQSAQALVSRTDPKLWNSTLYMPITRDLSTGKRKLLVEWAQSVTPGSS